MEAKHLLNVANLLFICFYYGLSDSSRCFKVATDTHFPSFKMEKETVLSEIFAPHC